LLTLGFQSGGECITWAEALQSEHILCQILWIVENTLNLQLIEKVENNVYGLFSLRHSGKCVRGRLW
jgi:hypothetical protein